MVPATKNPDPAANRTGAQTHSGGHNLAAAVALYVAHYNFCRWHGTLKMTPAMAARLTGHPWTMEELLTEAGFSR